MKRLNLYLIFILLATLLCQCEETPLGQTPIEKVRPGTVTVLNVKPITGGAVISYTPPADRDLLYVRAEYLRNGKLASTLSSGQLNTVTIEGLPPFTESSEVTLVAVDNSKNESESVKVTVTPLESPLIGILNSFNPKTDFGGFSASWRNKTNAEVGITILYDSLSLGVFKEALTYYSDKSVDSTFFGSFKDIKATFSVYLTDKWGNKSPEKKFELTPYYEIRLDGQTFKYVGVWDDFTPFNGDFIWENMFKDNLTAMGGSNNSPGTITLDMGKKIKLSKFKLWGRNDTPYTVGLKEWEIWGTDIIDETKILDKDYWSKSVVNAPWKSDWHLLGSYSMYKPGGEEATVTDEDVAYWNQGIMYKFNTASPAVRYFRIVVKSDWNGSTTGMVIRELAMWGDDKNFK